MLGLVCVALDPRHFALYGPPPLLSSPSRCDGRHLRNKTMLSNRIISVKMIFVSGEKTAKTLLNFDVKLHFVIINNFVFFQGIKKRSEIRTSVSRERRYVVNFDPRTKLTTLQFGSGNAETLDDDIIPGTNCLKNCSEKKYVFVIEGNF